LRNLTSTEAAPSAGARGGPDGLLLLASCTRRRKRRDGALKKAPADLTQIARKNGGKFPDVRVMRVIDGDDILASHGSRAMPIWGNVFRSLEGQGAETLRVNALMEYIRALQAN